MATSKSTKIYSALELQARANVKARNFNLTTKVGKDELAKELAFLTTKHANEGVAMVMSTEAVAASVGYCPDMPSKANDVSEWLDSCVKNGQDPRNSSNWDQNVFRAMFNSLSGTQENKIKNQFPNLFK